VLFAADAQERDPAEMLSFLEGHFVADEEGALNLSRVMIDYARRIVECLATRQDQIDAIISKISHNWKLERMSRVDRSILRLAITEMTMIPEVPARVALDEAIELARRYGADNSRAFVNGILDQLHPGTADNETAAWLHEALAELDQSAPTD
jgi:N utilization substance protein B